MALTFENESYVLPDARLEDEGRQLRETDILTDISDPISLQIIGFLALDVVRQEAEINAENRQAWARMNEKRQMLSCSDDEWKRISQGKQ